MTKNFGVGILIFCFCSSSINPVWATQAMPIAPAIPAYEIQELNQQMLDRDRQNRDEEIAIQNLVEENNKLTQKTLISQEDEGLKKLNDTIRKYNSGLLDRDKSRIVANGQPWSSRYGDLIALTEDADAMTEGWALAHKSDLLVQKYQMLTELKNEMETLNERLRNQGTEALNGKEKIIEGYKKIALEQQEKVRMLVDKLSQMDQKISRFDEILAEKDHQIAELTQEINSLKSQIQQQMTDLKQKDALLSLLQQTKDQEKSSDSLQAQVSSLKNQIQQQLDNLKAKDELIKEQEAQIALLQKQPVPSDSTKTFPTSADPSTDSQQKADPQAQQPEPSMKQIQNKVEGIKNDYAQDLNDYKRLENTVVSLKEQVGLLKEQLSQKQEQVDLLKSELEARITQEKNQPNADTVQVNQLRKELSQKQTQMDLLRSEFENKIGREKNQRDAAVNAQADQLRHELSQKQAQVDLLKSTLEKKIVEEKNQRPTVSKEQLSQQQAQVNVLKSELENKEKLIKAQADQMAGLSGQLKGQNTTFGNIQSKIASLKIRIKNQMQQQADALKAKDESIHWLNQVLAVAKNKAEYYKLSAQKERLYLQGARDEMQQIRDDFTKRFQDYDQLEKDILSLRTQVAQLGEQLSQKQQEMGSLQSQLADKATAAQAQSQQEAQQEQDIKTQLQSKEKEITSLKAQAAAIMQQEDKEKRDDRLKLAKQLIDLHQQEALLLQEKERLRAAGNVIFDTRFSGFENKMNGLLVTRRIQTADLQNRIAELNDELEQRRQQAGQLNAELKDKISEAQTQSVLAAQIQDLKSQVQDKENQITSMKAAVQSGRETQVQMDALKQQVADQQNKENLLKQELESKNLQSVEMTRLLSDYQKKLEDKNYAYNEELRKVLSSKNAQAAKLQEKESQDLSLSMVQQKVTEKEITEDKVKIVELQTINDKQSKELTVLKTDLALARQQLAGMPSSDEIEFLRTGLKKATSQLSEKDGMLSRIKANADEYEKEFKAQTKEFQSVKQQLQDAYEQINHKNEDLKYKNLEITRLKERSTVKEGDLEDQIKVLTSKLGSSGKIVPVKVRVQGNNAQALEAELASANAQIKDLQAQLNQFILPSKQDPLREKLKQALNKINEQGRFINVLIKKLQDSGQAGNITSYTGKE